CRAFSTRWIATSQLPDQRERLAKVRVLRATQPLEDGHLGRDDLRAVPFEPPDRRLLALGLPRTDRIPHEINALTRPDQAEHGLHDADMRLAAADDDIGPVRQRRREIRHTARVKAHLGEDRRRRAPRELRTVAPSPEAFSSVISTGTPNICAAFRSRRALATIAAPSAIAGISRL